jgi:hypothetical protein
MTPTHWLLSAFRSSCSCRGFPTGTERRKERFEGESLKCISVILAKDDLLSYASKNVSLFLLSCNRRRSARVAAYQTEYSKFVAVRYFRQVTVS